MRDEVELDQSDLVAVYRLAVMWETIFFSMDTVAMAISLGLNICLLRGVARNPSRKETPVFFLIFFLFFTSLVDDAVIAGQFIKLHHKNSLHTTALCQFERFVVVGNRLLQASTVLTMMYYAWIVTEFKKTAIETRMKKLFPMVILGLVGLEILLAIGPALGVRGNQVHHVCYYVDHSGGNRANGWLYRVVFPYYLPLVLASFPMIRIALRLRNASYSMTENLKIQNYIVLSICGGYFFFHLLYYVRMLGGEIEMAVHGKSAYGASAGRALWLILRPMFSLIGLGWHIIIPLAPFVFDKDFLETFPGKLVYRKRLERNKAGNEIGLTCRTDGTSNNAETGQEVSQENGHIEFDNPGWSDIDCSDRDEQESYQSAA